MSLLATLKKIIGFKVRYETVTSNELALNLDEIQIFEAVKKTRKWREGGTTPLCNNLYCSTGCNMRFRMIIKEYLADNDIDKRYFRALEPSIREKVKLFCENRYDLLDPIEHARLRDFYTELDERIPEEAQLKKKMEEKREQEYRQRNEAWRKKVEENRAVKKRDKEIRHRQRIALKRERDHYYWIAYWAAKHAIKDTEK